MSRIVQKSGVAKLTSSFHSNLFDFHTTRLKRMTDARRGEILKLRD